jgi:hypothetical protein
MDVTALPFYKQLLSNTFPELNISLKISYLKYTEDMQIRALLVLKGIQKIIFSSVSRHSTDVDTCVYSQKESNLNDHTH